MNTEMGRVRNKKWTRSRCCNECGKVEDVRKDSPSLRCKSCAAKSNSRGWIDRLMVAAQARATFCPVCGKKKHKLYTYCSVECRMTVTKVDRVCKCCGVTFKVTRSGLSGKTNASGNFCSRPCYEKFMCQTDRVTGRGSQWLKIRTAVKNRSPFCACCGTTKKQLQVHHIVPFRLTFDNSHENLVPLCLKCHKSIEHSVQCVEAIGASPSVIGEVFSYLIRARQDATRQVLRRLINGS